MKHPLTVLLAGALIACPPAHAQKDGQPPLKVEASSAKQWTGVAISSDGRLFVNYPYWSDNVPVSVAEIKDGKAVPYPSPEWNDRTSDAHFNAVQSVVIDAKDRLWVLDTNNPQFKGVQKQGPVLYQIDLKTNQKVKAYPFPEGVYRPNSYFNDVRIDTESNVAYLTDSGNGALIVLDLKSGESRRLLEGHPSVKSELDQLVCDGVVWKNSVDADGIALTPDRQYIYFIALTSHTLYRVETAALTNPELSPDELAEQVEQVAKVPATDGMMFDSTGNLWLGGLETNSINQLHPDHKVSEVLQAPSIRWADSFAIGRDGRIYFTTSQIHIPEDKRQQYQVLSFTPADPADTTAPPEP
ncbi:SMP-30/gluconolactonase/LRE family protein [Sulfuriroseicoccus oceanibius]|uniref:SMP-30/gluconolactonase/LRE family protein n=1 Tax=Sulfuriroseicoccus oceanibius TaxID=2707525 RepID=A0A6B3L441_9BACT|nr:L-dopachrome tautomerase-related protein [Sulfuriroseicoccus oceanibius]QQL44555.1 SMP-30/gluconolactonase/LRE family protein [Sulfuriroseicoccus oceanibius]